MIDPRVTSGPPAMDHDTAFRPGLSPVEDGKVQASVDGGLLSSNGGLLLLRELERKHGIAERLTAANDCIRKAGLPVWPNVSLGVKPGRSPGLLRSAGEEP